MYIYFISTADQQQREGEKMRKRQREILHSSWSSYLHSSRWPIAITSILSALYTQTDKTFVKWEDQARAGPRALSEPCQILPFLLDLTDSKGGMNLSDVAKGIWILLFKAEEIQIFSNQTFFTGGEWRVDTRNLRHIFLSLVRPTDYSIILQK